MNIRRIAVAVAVQVLLLTALSTSASAATPLPSSMASTGDSITRAYNTGGFFTDAPANSWSTGTSATVHSHYSRILAAQPAIGGKNFNDAVSGARMSDLAGQMTTVVGQKAAYVTVLMGGNDVCTSSVGTMTAVADFRAQFTAALNTLTTGLPHAKVFVASIPDAYRLWQLLKGNGSARFTWWLFGVCQSLLANPLSIAPADVARRNAVRQRNIDLNTQLQSVCLAYRQCRFDGGAVFNTAFLASDVSTRDYFHPSLAGQAKLAAATWSVSYWGP